MALICPTRQGTLALLYAAFSAVRVSGIGFGFASITRWEMRMLSPCFIPIIGALVITELEGSITNDSADERLVIGSCVVAILKLTSGPGLRQHGARSTGFAAPRRVCAALQRKVAGLCFCQRWLPFLEAPGTTGSCRSFFIMFDFAAVRPAQISASSMARGVW